MEPPSRNRFLPYASVLIFLVILSAWSIAYYRQFQKVAEMQKADPVAANFAGNDWISWEDKGGQVKARRTHPLPGYKAFPKERVQPGDRLRKIDYHEVYQAEVAETISQAAPPGKIFIYQVERPLGEESQLLTLQVINGYRLAFGFNQIGTYWRVGVWMAGIGTFVAFLVLLILFPFFRSDWKVYLSLLLVVGLGLTHFILQLGHALYLIIEADLVETGVEEVYCWAFPVVAFAYVLAYFFFKVGPGFRWLLLPSGMVAVAFLYLLFWHIWGEGNLKPYQRVFETFALGYILLHSAAPVLLAWVEEPGPANLKRNGSTGLVALISLLGLGWFAWAEGEAYEHGLFIFYLLLFFPLVNAAYFQLRFGKVSVVVTRSLQYLVFAGMALFGYALINQFFGYLIPNNPYRELIEITILILAILVGYALFRANESRLGNYFVTAQQERQRRLATFIATLPQFTSSQALFEAFKAEVGDYFETDLISFWWQGRGPEVAVAVDWEEDVFVTLATQNTVWSRNKELSGASFALKTEEALLLSSYSLIAPLQVSEDRYGLLLLGGKKRGVYNLSDLEQISRLVQQIQLTLSVLQLLQREKELIQQSYEANLTALRSQINPHFLFNTLNTISALIHDSPDLAEEAVEKLAFIFRYTLKVSDQNLVALEKEIQLVRTYLDIEKIRFGSRLQIDIDMEPEVAPVQIPAFVLQTLAENCIKHGIAKIIGKGIIAIDAYREEEYLVCEVYDNGPGIDPERISQGTGLNNVLARLENIYGMKNLLYFEDTGEGTRVQLKIPLV